VSARSGSGEGDGRAEGGFDGTPAQRIGCVVVDHRRPTGPGEKIEIRYGHGYQENAADIGHAVWQHPLAGHLVGLAVRLMLHHAGHGGAAHVGIGRISRRDLQHRGAEIGGHDQQGEYPTQQLHRHPLLGTAPTGSGQGARPPQHSRSIAKIQYIIGIFVPECENLAKTRYTRVPLPACEPVLMLRCQGSEVIT